MKLINVGIGRTGTNSLKAALEILDCKPSHNSIELLSKPGQMDFWESAFDGQAVDWREFYADYQVAGWPSAIFFREIITAHPEAKVLMTVRDPEAWVESMQSLLKMALGLRLPIPHLRRIQRFVSVYTADRLFEGKLDDRDHLIACYKRHIADVQAFVPAENLLLYQVTDGWEPLCQFIDAPVPAVAFPHENKRGGMRATFMKLISRFKG